MSQNIHRPVDWEQLVNENENHLYRAALAILRDVHEAEDAVQDAFVKYLEKAPDQLENPAAWLMRVLVNGCKSRLRRAGRRELPAVVVDNQISETLFRQVRALDRVWAMAMPLNYALLARLLRRAAGRGRAR